MKVILRTRSNEVVTGDTDSDYRFAIDNESPFLEYYYNTHGAVYAVSRCSSDELKIMKKTIIELKESISCSEIIDEEIAEVAYEALS